MTDVVTAAWIGAGRPTTSTDFDSGLRGLCARCGTTAPLVPVSEVVSRNFTGFDGWTTPTGRGLCDACTWAYRAGGLRQHAHLVIRRPGTMRCLSAADTYRILARGGAEADRALVVPLRAGRKHLLPNANWGAVQVDDVQLPWATADRARLRTVQHLRSLGFGPRTLSDPAPPYAVLRRLPRRIWPEVITAWQTLAPWRAHPVWLTLAVTVTVTVTTPAPAVAT